MLTIILLLTLTGTPSERKAAHENVERAEAIVSKCENASRGPGDIGPNCSQEFAEARDARCQAEIKCAHAKRQERECRTAPPRG